MEPAAKVTPGAVVTSVAVVIGVVLLCSAFAALKTVEEGSVGVVKRWGKLQSEVLDPGIHFVVPYMHSVVNMDTRLKKEQVGANAGTKDLQIVNLQIAVNYRINKSEVTNIYRNLGDDELIKDKVLTPSIQEVVKSATAQYTAAELLTKRGEVSTKIDTELRERLSKYDLVVDDVSVVDLQYSKEFDQAIEAKQVAEQRAQQAQYELDKARKDIEQIKLQKQQLDDRLLMQQWIEKWNGQLPAYVGDGDFLLQLPGR